MARAIQEIQSIPLRYIIGGPLTAVIQAQAEAAQTTIQFIEQVGFSPNPTDLAPGGAERDLGPARSVTFTYKKVQPDGTTADAVLTVPVLSIVPVPFIRIDTTTIDFTAKITDIETVDVKTALSVGADVKASYSSWLSPVSVELRASFSYKRTTESDSKFILEYQMHINVHAVQEDMPGGLAKVLQLLEKTIVEKPKVA